MRHPTKNLRAPDETRTFPFQTEGIVEVGDYTVGRTVVQPGWHWKEHISPVVGTEWCQARHVGVVEVGRLRVELTTGETFELAPDDVYEIPAGHDAWVLGEEPCVLLQWTGVRAFSGYDPAPNRILRTLVFTDIVDSTEKANRLGDGVWRERLATHFEAARAALELFGGTEVKTTGDGMLAMFESTAKAVRCAAALRNAAPRHGVNLRIGVHVGEVEPVPGDLRGVAVHEAARIMSSAEPDEILVSDTTRVLSVASGLTFDDRGTHELKGLDGEWHLYALAEESPGLRPANVAAGVDGRP